MKILFKYTTRSRPEHFERGLKSILENVSSDNYMVQVTVDVDDLTMNEMIHLYRGHKHIIFIEGLSTGKINAINRDLDKLPAWDILVNMSDDMLFIEKGFDNIIREKFYPYDYYHRCYFTDREPDLDRYIHFNDGNQRDNVCTLHIVGRDYFNRFNYIYHPDYISLWCDVENDLVAKQLGCYRYQGDNVKILKHLHPAFNLAFNDDQYKKNEAREMWIADERTFNRRKQINFGL